MLSDAAEELLRREAEHTGQSIEQIVGEMIEADAQRRAQQRLVRELDEGLEAAKQGRVVTIDAGQSHRPTISRPRLSSGQRFAYPAGPGALRHFRLYQAGVNRLTTIRRKSRLRRD